MSWLFIHIVYLLITSTISLICYYFKNNFFIITKPLPIFGLIIFQIVNMIFSNNSTYFIFIILISIALFFSMIGDILLIKKNLFIPGMLFFMLAHIFYIIRFKEYKWQLPSYIFIIIGAISILFGSFLTIKMPKDKKKGLIIPLWCYILAISLMLLSAINFEFNIKRIFPYYFIGAILFYISDAILSIDSFVKKFKISMLFVLITYYFAQMFISLGTILK